MHRLRNALLIGSALTPLALASALAGPEGGTVVGGSATINNPGTANVTVNQHSDKAIINWNLFNIGVGERATFHQPNTNSVVLNRVTGGHGPSEILGSLDANGKVFVVNRDGIIFGPGAVITTAGFLATTSDIRNEDFMAGRFNFQTPGRPDASIVNMGTITATSGGFAALVAPGVRNSGTITAALGTIGLAAGNTFSLDFYGDKLITLGVGDQIAGEVKDVATGQTLKSLVTNEGKLKANGGRVELTAAAARHVVDSVINTSGVIEANSVGTKGGMIVLGAATAGSVKGQGSAPGATARLPAQKVKVSGKLTASGKDKGTKGGSVIVTGEVIEVAGATIDASGAAGGGKVLIGGDWGGGKPDKSLVNNQSAYLENSLIPNATTVTVDAATHIDASAKDSGHGGKVVLWADDRMSFAGTILALGGAEFGNGGFAEVSGKGLLNYTGVADLRATNGSFGTLLLDPYDVTISNSPDNSGNLSGGVFAPTDNGSNLNVTTLQNALALANVMVTTIGGGTEPGNITVQNNVTWSSGSTLTLSANRNIQINENVTISNTGAGSLILRADSLGTGIGTITMVQNTMGSRVNWTGSTGTVSFFYNPTSYTSPTDFTPTGMGGGTRGVTTNGAVPNQFTAYMLVNNPTDLGNIATNMGGTYALGKDINPGAFSTIGGTSSSFTGVLDGLGHTISNLIIAPVAPSSFGISVGLFSTIGATGVVRNLNIDSATVTANPNVTGPGQFVGVLAGTNGGLVSNVHVTNSTVSHGTAQNGVIAGGLIGQNGIFGPNPSMGSIALSTAETTVSVGSASGGSSGNSAGGLVGNNPGTITDSFAMGDVSGGAFSFVGGLVGVNGPGAAINGTLLFTLSGASGNVSLSDATGAGAGGLVGFNFGSINNSIAIGNVTGGNSTDVFKAGGIGGLVGLNDPGGTISLGIASGNVTAGANSSAGGLVGFNNGTINLGFAGGTVSSLNNFAGGLVGFNSASGNINGGFATGDVSGGGSATGGLVGSNMGMITGSLAAGNVSDTSSGHDNAVGGFVGSNNGTISSSVAIGNVSGNNAGGFAGSNEGGGTIDSSFAGLFGFGGAVTVGNGGTGGGFVSGNHGTITNSSATGNVTGGSNSVIGGFAAGNFGTISDSTAFGEVSATGANGVVGGFAGANMGDLIRVTSSGPVSGTSDSFLGGLVGANFALIQDSTSSSIVTGSGGNNVAGGLVGMNFGLVDPSFATGDVSSGANSIVGGLIGANGALRFPDGSTVVGTRTADSTASGAASGGAGSTVGPQVGQDYPTSGLPSPPQNTCDGGGTFCGGTLFNPNGTPDRPTQPDNPQVPPPVVFAQLTTDTFTEKKAEEVVNTNTPSGGSSSGSPSGQKGGGNQGGNAGRPPAFGPAPYGLGPLPSGMPPANETRFLSNEVVFQLGGLLSDDELAETARRLGLQITYQETIGLLGRKVIRFRLPDGTSVRNVIAQLQARGANFSAQPSYTYDLIQDLAQSGGAPADTTRRGDSAQYIVEKLGLTQAHLIATGKEVKVAVIDSTIDARHPDLEGVITGIYDALPSDDQTPHPHGTGMAGAIASHKRLLGVAPGAHLLGIRAFGVNSGGAQGTSLNIVKGLQWAVDQGAKVINMSFAGPRDPILQQAMKRLTDQGIILIAAAGNAGPKSPPLYPGADPNVIAVSATDVEDKTYKNANRGKYVAIAAPGVDILVPAPEGGYQLTTGTSVAAAHISGVVALLLERNKELKAAEVRSILTATAKKTGAAATDVGAGLVDPLAALSKAGPKVTQLRAAAPR